MMLLVLFHLIWHRKDSYMYLDPERELSARNLLVSCCLSVLREGHKLILFPKLRSQARMVEAIDALSRRVEGLARSISTSLRAQRDGSPGGGSAGIASPL